MKKITLLIASIAMLTTGMAQVHVVNDAFIYSKGTDIFITKEIGLRDAGSKFYVRGEAQIIQMDATIANSGVGTFSVFQEGVANNFTYNYWSSPVSDPALGANAGFKNTQINFPTLMANFAFETDFVINAAPAVILAPNVRDGKTDQQTFDAVSGTTTVDRDLQIASRWLYSYKSADGPTEGGGGYFGWKPFQNSTEVVGPGYGFTMKGVNLDDAGPNIETSTLGSGQRYDLRGLPNTGDITVSVKNGDFSLVGNPYPSALDLKLFMNDPVNSGNIDGELYFWDSASTTHILEEYVGGYGTYVPDAPGVGDGMYTNATFTTYDANGIPTGSNEGGGGIAAPVGETATRRYAAIGQGFVIQRTLDDPATPTIKDGFTDDADGPTGSVTFKNTHRVFQRENSTSSIFKSAPNAGSDQTANSEAVTVRPKIKFNAFINKLYNRNMILAFGNDATLGWDWGMDGSNNANRVATDVYMPIEGRQAVIQTMPEITDETAVPLTVKSGIKEATFELKVTSFENFDADQVLIHDKQDNTYHDILNDSYTIETGKGTTEDRYEIVFQEKTTLGTSDVAALEGFNIFQNNEQSLLTVRNTSMKDVANIAIFDLAGRQVTTSNPKDVSADYTFNTTAYAAGIYIVKVTTTDKVEVATKVVISN